MANNPAGPLDAERRLLPRLRVCQRLSLALLALALLTPAPLLRAQNSPTVTAVDPGMGKVNDTVTVSGTNLGKASVSAIYLSDDKDDYKATIVNQADDKVTIKIPMVKPGSYNISVQVGGNLFIKPVHFSVQE